MGLPYVGPPPTNPGDIVTKGVVDSTILDMTKNFTPVRVLEPTEDASNIPSGTVVLRKGQTTSSTRLDQNLTSLDLTTQSKWVP